MASFLWAPSGSIGRGDTKSASVSQFTQAPSKHCSIVTFQLLLQDSLLKTDAMKARQLYMQSESTADSHYVAVHVVI